MRPIAYSRMDTLYIIRLASDTVGGGGGGGGGGVSDIAGSNYSRNNTSHKARSLYPA